MTTLSNRPVGALLELMASARPDPAAGSAAAYAVALACSLLGKTARLSRRQLDDAGTLAEESDTLRRRAVELAQADAELVAAAVSDSSTTTDANAVVNEIAEVAAEVQRLAAHLGEHGNPRLYADTQAAHHLAEAAVRTTRAIMRSNDGVPDGPASGSDDRP